MNDKKAQDILEQVRHGLSKVPGKVSDAGGAIKSWYENLNPDMKNTVMRGLLGAGVGGALTGGIAAMGKHDPEQKNPVMGPALLGALMGGVAGAGIPYGLKLLSNNVQFPGEEGRPGGAGILESLGKPFVTNPATTIGGAAGVGVLNRAMGYTKGDKEKPPEGLPLRKAWDATGPSTNSSGPKMSFMDILSKGGRNKQIALDNIATYGPSLDILDLAEGAAHPDADISKAFKSIIAEKGKHAIKPEVIGEALKATPGNALRGGLNFANRVHKTWKAKPAGRWAMMAPLGGLAGGAIIDQYLKGDY